MIVFDLRCGAGHVFEAWFGSTADYDAQQARRLIACPVCDDTAIGKAVMAPAVPAKGNRALAAGGDPSEEKAMLAALAKLQAEVEARCENVGERFPDEARAVHRGEAPARAIYGLATPADAAALAEEGIEVGRLPFKARGTPH